MSRAPKPTRSALPLLLALAVTVFATAAAAQPRHGAFVDDAALDTLFAQLRLAPDEVAARRIDQDIWALWTTPTDPELASRMNAALAARAAGDPLRAIRLLDTIVADYPDYAEGWNQRATMYYALGDYDASIADCARVLALEPRHFGALSGRALMYLSRGQRALALRDMAAALDIHPFLAGRQNFPELQQNVTRV